MIFVAVAALITFFTIGLVVSAVWWAIEDRRTAERLHRLDQFGLIRRIDDVPVITGHVIEPDPDTDLPAALEQAWDTNPEEAA